MRTYDKRCGSVVKWYRGTGIPHPATLPHYHLTTILLLALLTFNFSLSYATESDDDTTMMKAASMEAGKMTNDEAGLYEQSIKATKQSIARETLKAFYNDAVEYYHEERYDEALELLDKIYSIDPYYEDVRTLRETIQRLQENSNADSKRDVIDGYMRKGDDAAMAGQNILAVSFWKKALIVDPNYKPALQKIQTVNRGLAQKQFEQGYLHYHHGDMEDALDNWQNAIALDPSLKQRGLLLLMSKVEIAVQRDQVNRLTAQAAEQYQQNDLPSAYETYQQLLKLDPRHDEARRMSAKIRFHLGMSAFKAGRDAMSQGHYAEAIQDFQTAIQYGFEPQQSQQAIQQAKRRMTAVEEKQAEPKEPPEQAAPAATPAPATPPTPAPAPAPTDPAGALVHYRQGLAAFRNKDFHRALDELKIANQLDPSNEHIYIALQRAQQEWSAASGQGTGQ